MFHVSLQSLFLLLAWLEKLCRSRINCVYDKEQQYNVRCSLIIGIKVELKIK